MEEKKMPSINGTGTTATATPQNFGQAKKAEREAAEQQETIGTEPAPTTEQEPAQTGGTAPAATPGTETATPTEGTQPAASGGTAATSVPASSDGTPGTSTNIASNGSATAGESILPEPEPEADGKVNAVDFARRAAIALQSREAALALLGDMDELDQDSVRRVDTYAPTAVSGYGARPEAAESRPLDQLV
jgi:hypothetical protein